MSQQHLTLPTHPVTGRPAVGWRNARSGEDPDELYPIWPIVGAAPGEDDDDDESDEGDDNDDQNSDEGTKSGGDSDGDDDDDESDDDKPLGPKGEKALTAEKDKRRKEADRRRSAEKERDEAKAELVKLRKAAKSDNDKSGDDAGKDDDAPDPDEIKAEAEKTATEKANQRILRAEVKATAAGKLADPTDALRFLDLTKFEVDTEGEVDTEEIGDAIDDLLTKKPYLAAQGGDKKKFKGSGDGGAKPQKPQRPKSLNEAVTRALTPNS